MEALRQLEQTWRDRQRKFSFESDMARIAGKTLGMACADGIASTYRNCADDLAAALAGEMGKLEEERDRLKAALELIGLVADVHGERPTEVLLTNIMQWADEALNPPSPVPARPQEQK